MELARSAGVFGTFNFFEVANGVCKLSGAAARPSAEEACSELGTAEGPDQLARNTCLWTLSSGKTVLGTQA